MKKSLFIIAATALVISCSSNDSFKEIETQDVPIGFGNAYIGKITKANDGEMNVTTIATGSNRESSTSMATCCAWPYR